MGAGLLDEAGSSFWAATLKDAIAKGGPESIGVLGGGRLLNEEAYLLGHIFRALGTENIDWRTGRQRTASHGSRNTLIALEAAQVVVTYGRPPAQIAPIMDLRIRKAVSQHGAKLLSVGPLPADAFVPEQHVASIEALRAALPAKYDRIAFVWDGVPRPMDAAFLALRDELAGAGKTVGFYIPSEQPNARGADALGLRPGSSGRHAHGMLEAARDGSLRALAIFGANPMLRFPERALVDAALAAVPFLVVSEMFLTATAERANLVLPARGPFEKSGSSINVEGALVEVRAGLEAPAGTLSDGEILVVLADALGITLPDANKIHAKIESAVSSPPAIRARAQPAAASAAPGLMPIHAETIFSVAARPAARRARRHPAHAPDDHRFGGREQP